MPITSKDIRERWKAGNLSDIISVHKDRRYNFGYARFGTITSRGPYPGLPMYRQLFFEPSGEYWSLYSNGILYTPTLYYSGTGQIYGFEGYTDRRFDYITPSRRIYDHINHRVYLLGFPNEDDHTLFHISYINLNDPDSGWTRITISDVSARHIALNQSSSIIFEIYPEHDKGFVGISNEDEQTFYKELGIVTLSTGNYTILKNGTYSEPGFNTTLLSVSWDADFVLFGYLIYRSDTEVMKFQISTQTEIFDKEIDKVYDFGENGYLIGDAGYVYDGHIDKRYLPLYSYPVNERCAIISGLPTPTSNSFYSALLIDLVNGDVYLNEIVYNNDATDVTVTEHGVITTINETTLEDINVATLIEPYGVFTPYVELAYSKVENF